MGLYVEHDLETGRTVPSGTVTIAQRILPGFDDPEKPAARCERPVRRLEESRLSNDFIGKPAAAARHDREFVLAGLFRLRRDGGRKIERQPAGNRQNCQDDRDADCL